MSGVLDNFLDPLKSMKQLPKIFGITTSENSNLWETFKNDKSFMQQQKLIDDEVTHCFNQLQNYLKTWEPFSDVWEVNKDMFIKRYISTNHYSYLYIYFLLICLSIDFIVNLIIDTKI